jgi:hypothetical protein
VGSLVDRAELGQVCSEYFGFPCHSFDPVIAPEPSYVIQGSYNRPINGGRNSGLVSTPAPKIDKKARVSVTRETFKEDERSLRLLER